MARDVRTVGADRPAKAGAPRIGQQPTGPALAGLGVDLAALTLILGSVGAILVRVFG
jgi:hypothetical protein